MLSENDSYMLPPHICASTNGSNLVVLQHLRQEVLCSHRNSRAVQNAQATAQLIQPCGKQCGSITFKSYAEEMHPHKRYELELTVQYSCF